MLVLLKIAIEAAKISENVAQGELDYRLESNNYKLFNNEPCPTIIQGGVETTLKSLRNLPKGQKVQL